MKCKEYYNNINDFDNNSDNESDYDSDFESESNFDSNTDNYVDFSRGYIEMACGSGKTLTSYWIDKEFNNKKTVIFVPSLHLLSQFFSDWINQSYSDNIKINYLLIGSDADVDDDIKYNSIGLILYNDPIKIHNYITNVINNNEKLVVISTYQSSDKLANKNIVFDFGIFDEAHKTVGQGGKQFSKMLDNDNMIITKRLLMTATPKMYIGLDEDILSMDNEKYYGKQIFCYNTGNGINDKMLVDYQLVTLVATNKEIVDIININKLVKYNNEFDDEESNYLGIIILILKKIHDGTCNHMVTYHNTVKRAQKFMKFLEIINSLLYTNTNLYVNSFDGTTSMGKRKKIIKEYIDNAKAILCTARV